MTADIVESWEQFKNVLKLYGNAHLLLNPPCSIEQIHDVIGKFGFDFPASLKSLLSINNGQRMDDEGIKKGIFKSVSGWDVYERHVFLSLEEIQKAYISFLDDKVLTEEFGVNEIPFAVAPSPTPHGLTPYREAFCINSLTGRVSLIWKEHIDPLDPPEWQVAKFERAESLAAFIARQTEQYR